MSRIPHILSSSINNPRRYGYDGSDIVTLAKENDAGTTAVWQVAGEMAPDDPFIADFLRIFSNEEEGALIGKHGKPEKKINLIRGRITMKKTSLAALILFVLIFALMSNARAQSPQQTLDQYVSDLQKNPNDNALREKIIKHVQTMRPSPAIPEEARRHYVMAKTFYKDAKKIEDYNASIDRVQECSSYCPLVARCEPGARNRCSRVRNVTMMPSLH